MASEFAASTRAASCGIDTGVDGAVALITDDGNGNVTAEVHDLPTHTVTVARRKRRATSVTKPPPKRKRKAAPSTSTKLAPYELAALLRGLPASRVFVEAVGPRPTQGIVSTGQFLRAAGVIEGVVAALGLSMVEVQPQAWQKHHRIGGGKDDARRRAQQLYPHLTEQLRGERGEHRADALLIAHYGLHVLSGNGRK
jgi:hypothetical protein